MEQKDDAVLIWLHHLPVRLPVPLPLPLSSHLATKNLSGGFEILVQLIAQLAMWLRLRLSTQPAVGIKVSPCGLSYGGSHVQWKYIDTKDISTQRTKVCLR